MARKTKKTKASNSKRSKRTSVKNVKRRTSADSRRKKAKYSMVKDSRNEEVSVTIVNIVISSSLEQDIPLEKMAATLSNTEYNPEQFPGLVIRIKEPKTSALIFSSGKIVLTGARSLEDVDRGIEKIIKSLKKINIDVKIKPIVTVQNIVASGSIGMDLNLNTLAIKLSNTEYEPEQFPGLVYKLKGTKATFLLFTNGKIVCTGTKTEEEVYKALDKLVETLKKVR
jgi:transcription initiation factor TFIID TATA-box-binding protein